MYESLGCDSRFEGFTVKMNKLEPRFTDMYACDSVLCDCGCVCLLASFVASTPQLVS